MKDIRKLTFSEKEQLIRYLAKIYRKGKLHSSFAKEGIFESTLFDETIDLSSQIYLILKRMTPADAVILENDFFDIKNNDWWRNCYSSRGYHIRKRIAMEQFLRCLYI